MEDMFRGMSEKKYHKWVEGLSDEDSIKEQQRIIDLSKKHPLYKESAEFRSDVRDSEKALADFIDTCMEEAVANLKYESDMDGMLNKAEKHLEGIRKGLIEALAKGGDIKNLKRIIDGIIKIEKKYNLFDPKNWKGYL